MSCSPSRVKITVGEDKEFKIFLRDEDSGNPIDLSAYTSGAIKFINCQEVCIEVAVQMPGANPASGEVLVTLTPTETDQFDSLMTDMQLNLTDGSTTRIVVLKNKLEVIDKLC